MPPQPQREATFAEKMQFVQNLMHFPALSVMVLLRRNLGYRLLNPLHIAGVSLVLFVFGSLAIDIQKHEALQLFAGVVFVAGMTQRLRRWIDIRRGAQQHSFYVGDSRFEGRWFPAFIRRNRRFTRIFDPLLCLFGGIVLLEPCRPLGLWLVLSGLALRFLEDKVRRESQERDCDLRDGLIEAGIQEDAVEEFIERPHPSRPQKTAVGIPTGLSPDLKRLVRKNQTNR